MKEKRILYSIQHNCVIPKSTFVIAEDNVCDDEYNDVLKADLIQDLFDSKSSNKLCKIKKRYDNECPYDYSFLERNTCTTYRGFIINCNKDKYVCIITSLAPILKMWINGKLFSVYNGKKRRISIALLKRGNNSIIMELPKTTSKSRFLVRFSDYEFETCKENTNAIFVGNMYPVNEFGHAIHSGVNLFHGEKFVFAFYPDNDLLEDKQEAEFELSDSLENTVFFKKKVPIKKKVEIDVSEYNIDEQFGNNLCVTIRYRYRNGYVKEEKFPIYKQDPSQRIEQLVLQAKKLLNGSIANQYDKLALRQGVEYISKFGRELGAIMAQATVLRNNIIAIKNGDHLDQTIYQSGTKRVFFYNPMYQAVNYYRIYVPENYSPNRKYPLVIIYSTLEYDDRARYFDQYDEEDVIAADVSMRGMTLGSYIGEAAIRYAVEDIVNRFSIDQNRIYCTGLSNGAGGVWAQAETFPDMFAGICAVSGRPNLNMLCNLNANKVVCISGEVDEQYEGNFLEPSEQLKEHPDFKGISFPGMTHSMLEILCFKKNLWKEILLKRKEDYPKRVVYKTISNRHRKSYWLEIHSIEPDNTEGIIEGGLASNLIRINCSGITGFSIKVPPEYGGTDFEVIFNDKETCFIEECNEEKLHFVKDSFLHPDTGEICPYFRRVYNYRPIIDYSKGYGLLDVYFDPLTVVLPDDASEMEWKTGVSFSEPYCNAVLPKIYIQYPITSYSEFCLHIEEDRSYVVIDDGSNIELLEEIRRLAPIKVGGSYWEYNGRRKEGSYCVMQLVKSPWKEGRHILLVQYSSTEMLQKNLFTRKLTIPSYVYGKHPYLNNMALIFGEQGYEMIESFQNKT